MSFLPGNVQDPFFFDHPAVKDLGKDLHEKYSSADPFPHIVIDDFLPAQIIDYCLEHFPVRLDRDGREFDRDQERYKKSYQPDYLEPKLRALFYTFNSRPFIKVIENITGIKGLIPDPYFLGGGFHEISTGGHLSVHADFNHHGQMDLERRVNMLIYLNPDWKEEYGGQLELWNTGMERCVQSIVPIANRCAMFTTTNQSLHGNPRPIAHPDGRSRKSIALYYYTSTWDAQKIEKTTQFHPRPRSGDRYDWAVKTNEFITEYFPPILSRRMLGLAHRLGRSSPRRPEQG